MTDSVLLLDGRTVWPVEPRTWRRGSGLLMAMLDQRSGGKHFHYFPTGGDGGVACDPAIKLGMGERPSEGDQLCQSCVAVAQSEFKPAAGYA